MHSHIVEGRIISQVKTSSGNRRLFTPENPYNFKHYTSIIVSGDIERGPEFEEWIANMAFNYDLLIRDNVFMFDGNIYEMEPEDLAKMRDFVSDEEEPEVTDIQETLIVEIEKDLLVELYNFAYEQARITGMVDVLHDIDRRIHTEYKAQGAE
jgi:hypothetical protein